MSLLKFDPAQSRITDYYKTIDKVEELVTSNPELISMFKFSTVCPGSNQFSENSNSSNAISFRSFFRKIVENANRNADKSIPQTRRHDAVIKKFATSLLLYGGPMAYNLIQQNMESALPSLRTVQRAIQSQYHHISEGQFQFDELVRHLTKYNAPFVVAISEDATRIISRVDYDKETDRMVGFILPCNQDGLPLIDSYLATSFEAIEHCFSTHQVSKFAYLYVAQCIFPTVPAFCLACIGNNLSFTAVDVLKRWRYIYEECQKRNITIVSFGGDGDSRLLRAMKISCQFKVQGIDKGPGLCTLSPSSLTSSLKLPKEWTWFWIEKPTPILCIQDYVHVAVKLKSRLLKPSVILPMGQYLAGSHHLKILVDTFAKDQHGIRQKDLSHKDKQNFDAVTRITSSSVLTLLEKFPDAKGTMKYLQLVRNFMDAFLDKCLLPLERIKKVWNAIFLLRYWHRWLCLNKKFTVRENFITSNANCGIELNGHALIILLILMRDVIPNGNELFCPWLLGSQPCEQTFRAARSMTGTFSTIINFSMYGLLNRLHRLQIQLQLESEMHETGIQYPRVTRHIKKSGFSAQTMLPNLKEISNEDICDAVQSARADAISTLEDLGIFVKGKDGKWEDLTVKIVNNVKHDDDDDDERDDEDEDEDLMEERKNSKKDCSEIINEDLQEDDLQEDVSALEKAGLVDRQLFERVRMKRILSNTISLYSPDEEADTKQNHCHQKKHSEFIPVSHNNKTVYIRKSTAIWLFQEFERVSSDRLFRVRAKQPNSSEFQVNLSEKKLTVVKSLPQKCEVINIGDMCVFQKYRCGEWKIGKVLQFFYHSGKTPKAQQCKQTSMKFTSDDTNNVSVVCTWFIWHAPLSLRTFVISPSSTSHHCVINEYAFTLTEGCFELQQMEDCEVDGSIVAQHSNRLKLACSYILIISEESMQFLEENLKQSDDECYVTEAEDSSLNIIVGPGKGNAVWKKYGCYQLTVQHRSQLLGNHLLCDIHIGAAQALIHRQFPAIGGLQNTVLQYSKSLQPFTNQQNIQIVHVVLGRIHHWVVVSTVGCNKDEIEVYDSLQMKPNLYTQTVIAQYLRSQSHSFKIKVANVATQKGCTDCGLYAIAMMTSLAYNENPVNLIYNQQDMRIHLEQCFEKGILEKFPFSKTRRITKQFSSETEVFIYCKCRLPDPEDGSKMIQCDNCQEWYHIECVQLDPKQPTTDVEWFCEKCQP